MIMTLIHSYFHKIYRVGKLHPLESQQGGCSLFYTTASSYTVARSHFALKATSPFVRKWSVIVPTLGSMASFGIYFLPYLILSEAISTLLRFRSLLFEGHWILFIFSSWVHRIFAYWRQIHIARHSVFILKRICVAVALIIKMAASVKVSPLSFRRSSLWILSYYIESLSNH